MKGMRLVPSLSQASWPGKTVAGFGRSMAAARNAKREPDCARTASGADKPAASGDGLLPEARRLGDLAQRAFAAAHSVGLACRQPADREPGVRLALGIAPPGVGGGALVVERAELVLCSAHRREVATQRLAREQRRGEFAQVAQPLQALAHAVLLRAVELAEALRVAHDVLVQVLQALRESALRVARVVGFAGRVGIRAGCGEAKQAEQGPLQARIPSD